MVQEAFGFTVGRAGQRAVVGGPAASFYEAALPKAARVLWRFRRDPEKGRRFTRWANAMARTTSKEWKRMLSVPRQGQRLPTHWRSPGYRAAIRVQPIGSAKHAMGARVYVDTAQLGEHGYLNALEGGSRGLGTEKRPYTIFSHKTRRGEEVFRLPRFGVSLKPELRRAARLANRSTNTAQILAMARRGELSGLDNETVAYLRRLRGMRSRRWERHENTPETEALLKARPKRARRRYEGGKVVEKGESQEAYQKRLRTWYDTVVRSRKRTGVHQRVTPANRQPPANMIASIEHAYDAYLTRLEDEGQMFPREHLRTRGGRFLPQEKGRRGVRRAPGPGTQRILDWAKSRFGDDQRNAYRLLFHIRTKGTRPKGIVKALRERLRSGDLRRTALELANQEYRAVFGHNPRGFTTELTELED